MGFMEQFHSGDQRVRLGLDLVKHPRNGIRANVLAATAQDSVGLGRASGIGTDVGGMKFKCRRIPRH